MHPIRPPGPTTYCLSDCEAKDCHFARGGYCSGAGRARDPGPALRKSGGVSLACDGGFQVGPEPTLGSIAWPPAKSVTGRGNRPHGTLGSRRAGPEAAPRAALARRRCGRPEFVGERESFEEFSYKLRAHLSLINPGFKRVVLERVEENLDADDTFNDDQGNP